MIGALVGGFVGGCIGAGMRSPKVVVRESDVVVRGRVKEQWHDIDYDRLAKKIIDNLKQERIQAINDRKTKLLQMEEARKCGVPNVARKLFAGMPPYPDISCILMLIISLDAIAKPKH